MFEGAHFGQQVNMNHELKAKYPYGKVSRGEKKALRRARTAEMRFRIEKGYEKDNLMTHIKYWFFKR